MSPAWGVTWLGSWGDSWGPLVTVDEHRPRTHPNLKLHRIREGYVLLSGVEARATIGHVKAKGAVVTTIAPPAYSPAIALAWGVQAKARVGQVLATGGGVIPLPGVSAAVSTGDLTAAAGGTVAVHGQTAEVSPIEAEASGGAAVSPEWDEGADCWTSPAAARGVINPTDEELAVIAMQLLKLVA